MLYFDFKNYEEFKEIFGVIEHGNGVKSRKNKILLSLYKDKEAFRTHIRHLEYDSVFKQYVHCSDRIVLIEKQVEKDYAKLRKLHEYRRKLRERKYSFTREECSCNSLLSYRTLPMLKCELMYRLRLHEFAISGADSILRLMDCNFYSNAFETDHMNGLCEDGTLNAIRYRNIEKERMFKMKAGRMFEHILSCNVTANKLPLPIKRWLTEEFVAEWVEYARTNIGEMKYELHVDDDFEAIYSRDQCAGYDTDDDSFGSCMTGRDHWSFYRDAVKAKAAYLTNDDDMIVARCIVFTEVKDQYGKMWRLAERQYSKSCDQSLQRQLVMALIRDNQIDGYKKVGASCHDARAFIDNEGNSLEDKKFEIKCNLEPGDILSYQDTFKWYDYDCHTADNYEYGEDHLDETDETWGEAPEETHYSSFNAEDIPESEACWVESRDDWFYRYQTVSALVLNSDREGYHSERCFDDDCIEIGGDYYYAGDDACDPEYYNIFVCPECGDYFVIEHNDSYYSELTETSYCCSYCREKAERDYHIDHGHVYAQYDDAWYDADEVIEAKRWANYLITPCYVTLRISIDDFNSLVEDGKATEFCGNYYIDDVKFDGEPLHLSQEDRIVA